MIDESIANFIETAEKTLTIRLVKMVDSALTPEPATSGSSGVDLRALEPGEIWPGQWTKVRTGLRLEIPEGYEAQVRSRSGLAAKAGVVVLNSPGTIDASYRGEICVLLINHGVGLFKFNAGDRIAQLVFAPVMVPEFVETSVLSDTDRGTGGFGSTGVK